MKQNLCKALLLQENEDFEDTGGRSEGNADFGFRPAFLDDETDTVYLSRFPDGNPARASLQYSPEEPRCPAI